LNLLLMEILLCHIDYMRRYEDVSANITTDRQFTNGI
jgi:hypothetical protein